MLVRGIQSWVQNASVFIIISHIVDTLAGDDEEYYTVIQRRIKHLVRKMMTVRLYAHENNIAHQINLQKKTTIMIGDKRGFINR